MAKLTEKEKAIAFRKKGLSYKEILEQVPVAKSTLSLWLRSVGLSKRQAQRLTAKKLASMRRGWIKWRKQRIDLTNEIINTARAEIGKLTKRELWLVGIALYWAEGTKEREASIGQPLTFNNSDPKMIKVYLQWLKIILKVPENEMKYEIYIHKTANYRKALEFWSRVVGVSQTAFTIYFKKHNIVAKYRNTGGNYYGLLRIKVRRSSHLNRKVAGWTEGLSKSNIAGSSNGSDASL